MLIAITAVGGVNMARKEKTDGKIVPGEMLASGMQTGNMVEDARRNGNSRG